MGSRPTQGGLKGIRMPRSVVLEIASSAFMLTAAPAFAASVSPLSYDMPNGNAGTYNYWDQIYSGAGCVTCGGNAPLSGGLGDLTDGIVAGDNWFVTEAPAGNGPYVGWLIDPTITFKFSAGTAIDSIRIDFDDSNGLGGVSAPSGFNINGTFYAVAEPVGSAPSFLSVGGLDFVGDTLIVTAVRKSAWLMLSEVTFAGPSGAVPEPATWAMMILGFGFVGGAMRSARRRQKVTLSYA